MKPYKSQFKESSYLERKSLNKFEVDLIMKFDQALSLLNKAKSYVIKEHDFKETTIRDAKNFNKTLKQAYDLLYEISDKIEDIPKSSLQDYSLTLAVEVIYRCTGHKYTNHAYTFNIKHNLKSRLIPECWEK